MFQLHTFEIQPLNLTGKDVYKKTANYSWKTNHQKEDANKMKQRKRRYFESTTGQTKQRDLRLFNETNHFDAIKLSD